MIKYSIAIKGTKPGTKKAEITETKAYGEAQTDEILSLDEFCKHIAEHHSPFSKGTIKGVLSDAVGCLREQLLAGNKVKLGDLGDFHVELATKGAKTTEEFNTSYIENVNVRWTPGKDFKNLRSEADFQLVPNRKAQSEAIETVKNTDTIQGLE
ncbi:MAG: HU family DNA-binding protein [Bacteroidaceae bacterium]|jgi:predicted histone-like DNA-binding protein|nr:HU family DNA-binding protein [Bacteroidaceae bacterium]MBQ2300762.1 HU family DNA-binding protein [Bacteroidaceae bacterium]MBQ5680682.1 HU family DNA-binding protein [Bacteroidaceae bacterium]